MISVKLLNIFQKKNNKTKSPEKEINITKINKNNKCSKCEYFTQTSIKYGSCRNPKTNIVNFVYDPTSSVDIQVPKFGTCVNFKKIINE